MGKTEVREKTYICDTEFVYECKNPPIDLFPVSSSVPCLKFAIGTTYHTLMEGAAPLRLKTWDNLYNKCLINLDFSVRPVPIIIRDPALGKIGNFYKGTAYAGKGIDVCTSFAVHTKWWVEAAYY